MPLYSQATSVGSGRPRAILVIAHPGHELRVHGWLEIAIPEVWILTDGSGRTSRSRIDSTTRVLKAIGALPGPVYGQMSDADLYHAVLTFDHRRFKDLVDQLAAALIRDRVECIAGDGAEGYNPAHDICRLVINAAIKLVKCRTSKQPLNYDFTLVGTPSRCSEEPSSQSLWLNLDDASFARKLSAARNYPELQAEVASALLGIGNEPFRQHADLVERAHATFGVTELSNFRVECLRLINSDSESNPSFKDDVPFYEEYGERQVRAGHYQHVLRYSEHILPLAAALDSHVERSS